MTINKTTILEIFDVNTYVDYNTDIVDNHVVTIDDDVYEIGGVVYDGKSAVSKHVGNLSSKSDYINKCKKVSYHYLPMAVKQSIVELLPMDDERIENVKFLIKRVLLGE